MTTIARRVAAGLVGSGAAAFILTVAPSAVADPPPNCTAADLAGITSGVAASTSAYLFTHPEVNDFYTGLEGSDRETIIAKQKEFFAANPQVKDEMTAIRQPIYEAKERCGNPLEPLVP